MHWASKKVIQNIKKSLVYKKGYLLNHLSALLVEGVRVQENAAAASFVISNIKPLQNKEMAA